MTKYDYKNFLWKAGWIQSHPEMPTRRKIKVRGERAWTSAYGYNVSLNWEEEHGPTLRVGADFSVVATGREAIAGFDSRTIGGAQSWKNDRILPF